MFRPTHADKQRIKFIGREMTALPPGKKASVCVDRGGEYEGKADWYLARFKDKFPALNAEYVGALTPEIDTIIVHSPACNQN